MQTSNHCVQDASIGIMCEGPKTRTPGTVVPLGVSLFSTLFSVAAIGGKLPRAFDCTLIIGRDRKRVKTRM